MKRNEIDYFIFIFRSLFILVRIHSLSFLVLHILSNISGLCCCFFLSFLLLLLLCAHIRMVRMCACPIVNSHIWVAYTYLLLSFTIFFIEDFRLSQSECFVVVENSNSMCRGTVCQPVKLLNEIKQQTKGTNDALKYLLR